MSDTTDLYKILGAERTATQDELKDKYRKLSLKWHPDKNRDNLKEATIKFQQISKAFNVLSDPKKRSVYDTHGDHGLEMLDKGIDPNAMHNPFASMFGMGGMGMGGMGGMGQQQRPQKASPIMHQVEVSLSELYNGGIKKFVSKYKSGCENCEGTGSSTKHLDKCSMCNGHGIRQIRQQMGGNMIQITQQTCPGCQGKGKISDAKNVCQACQGKAFSEKHRELEFPLYPGMDWGMRIGLGGKGDELIDQIPGDLIVVLIPPENEKKKDYERNGADIVYTIDIPLVSALLGFKCRIIHPATSEILIVDYQEVVQPGSIFKIPGKGMPILDTDAVNNQTPLPTLRTKYGDMILKISIVLPRKIPPKSAEVLKHLFGIPAPVMIGSSSTQDTVSAATTQTQDAAQSTAQDATQSTTQGATQSAANQMGNPVDLILIDSYEENGPEPTNHGPPPGHGHGQPPQCAQQ